MRVKLLCFELKLVEVEIISYQQEKFQLSILNLFEIKTAKQNERLTNRRKTKVAI